MAFRQSNTAESNDAPTEAPARVFAENIATGAQPRHPVANAERIEDAMMCRYSKFGCDVEVVEPDKMLPYSNVVSTMKAALPQNAKVSNEAKKLMQECVTEFISFVTSEANDKCIGERRTTIAGQDITDAMFRLGFENYAIALAIYLARYRKCVIERFQKQTPSKKGRRGPAPVSSDESAEDEVERRN